MGIPIFSTYMLRDFCDIITEVENSKRKTSATLSQRLEEWGTTSATLSQKL